MRKLITMLPLAALLALASTAAVAEGEITCELHFVLSGWSAFYKTASGSGIVRCSNGQKMRVQIETRGGGLTVGKSEIDDGFGKFSNLYDIQNVLGTYISAEAHAGAVNSADAQAMTKGPVSLALSGTGRGWDLGVAFGKFTLSRPGANTQD
jgi:hypothetical protein